MRISLGSAVLFSAAAATFGQSAKHPFNADDWAAVHSIFTQGSSTRITRHPDAIPP
jgi:hypothetical protein